MLLDDVSLCDTCPQAPPTEVVRAIMWFPVTYSGEETSSAWERSWGVQTHSSREQEINLCACGSLKLGLCFGSNCGKKLTNPSLCLQAVTDAGGGCRCISGSISTCASLPSHSPLPSREVYGATLGPILHSIRRERLPEAGLAPGATLLELTRIRLVYH